MKTVNKMILGLVITGCVVLVIGFSLGGYKQMSNLFDSDGHYWGWRIQGGTNIDKEFDNIQNLNLEIDTSNVTIQEYAGNSIRVEARNVSKKMKIIDENGTLMIEDKNGIWGFGIGLFRSDGEVIIYVPQDKEFNSVEIDLDAGSINLDTLQSNSLEVQVDAGKLNGKSVICNRGEFEVDAGKISLDTIDGQSLKFDVNAGKIDATLVGKEEEYRYQAKCDVGTMEIGSYSANGINTKDSGGMGSRYIEAECNVGKIDIRMGG